MFERVVPKVSRARSASVFRAIQSNMRRETKQISPFADSDKVLLIGKARDELDWVILSVVSIDR